MKEGIRRLGVQGNSLKELLGKTSNDISRPTYLFSFLKDMGLADSLQLCKKGERGRRKKKRGRKSKEKRGDYIYKLLLLNNFFIISNGGNAPFK